jgi:hypothetical protein
MVVICAWLFLVGAAAVWGCVQAAGRPGKDANSCVRTGSARDSTGTAV